MDLFDFDNIKTEKANAMRSYRRLRKIGKMFRFVEICIALTFLSWCSSQLPIVLKISGEYFNYLSVFVVSPRFVFLVGNAIILTLFAKSGQLSVQNSTPIGSGIDLYDEFVKNSENSQKIETIVSLSKTEEIIYQDKQTIYEETPITTITDTETTSSVRVTVPENEKDAKIYRRSQSENLSYEISEKPSGKKLRRAETEKCRRVKIPGIISKNTSDCEEEISNDELNRKIEAFIAKQMRFHREESMAIVLQNQN